MAAYTATISAHKTLVANTADSVTFSAAWTRIEIYNRDASAVIFARADGTVAVLSADGTYAIPPGARVQLGPTQTLGATAGAVTEAISLISSGTPAYSVTALG